MQKKSLLTALSVIGVSIVIGNAMSYLARAHDDKPGRRTYGYKLELNDGPFIRDHDTLHQLRSADTLSEIENGRRRQLADRGTELTPAAEARGAELAVQRRIARVFAAADPGVGQRLDTFNWCFSNPSIVLVGWYGTVQSVTEDRGTLLVEICMAPRLARASGSVVYTNDYCTETWRLRGNQLELEKVVPAQNVRVRALQ